MNNPFLIDTPYLWLLWTAALLMGGLSLYAWRFRDASATPFAVLMLLGALTDGLYALETAATVLPLKVLCSELRVVPVAFLALGVLATVLGYTGYGQRLSRWHWLGLGLVPLLTVLLPLSDELHPLFRSQFRIEWRGQLPVLLWDRGPWFVVYYVYNSLLILASYGVLLASLRLPALRRSNTFLMLIGIAFPDFTDYLFQLRLLPVEGFNFTYPGLAVSGLCFGWALLYGRAFEVTPLARQAVLDNLDDPLVVLDSQGRIVDFNPAAGSAWGLAPCVIGLGVERLPPACAELFHAQIARREEVQIEHRTYLLVLSAVRSRWGRVLGYSLLGHDISDHKFAQLALEASEERFRALVEGASDAFFLHQVDGRLIMVNQRACESLGYTRAELLHMAVWDICRQDTRQQLTALWSGILPGDARTLETQHTRKNGSVFPVELRLSCYEMRGQRLFLVLARDITDRKQAQDRLLESERRFRSLFEQTPLAYQSLDIQGRFLDVNPALCELLGYRRDELLGRAFDEVWAEDTRSQFPSTFERFKREQGLHNELRLRHKDGSPLMVLIQGRVQRAADGQFIRTHCILTDITERRHMEDSLRDSTARYDDLAARIPVGIYTLRITAEGQFAFEYVSPRWCQLLGIEAEAVLQDARIAFDTIYPEDRDRLWQASLDVGRTLVPFRWEGRFLLNGVLRWLRLESDPTPLPNGDSLWNGVASDITDSMLARLALEQSERRFRSYFDLPLIGIAITSLDKGWLDINDRLCNILGYTREELLTKTWLELTHPDDLDADLAQFGRMLAGEIDGYSLEKRFLRHDGGVVPVNLSVACVRDAQGVPQYFVALLEDISARKRVETALRDSEERFRQLAEHITDIFWVHDWPQLKVAYVSPAFTAMTGIPVENLYHDNLVWRQAVHPEDRELAYQGFIAGLDNDGFSMEYRFVRTDGEVRWVHDSGKPVRNSAGQIYRVVGVVRDITERKRADAELVRYRHHLEDLVAERTAQLEDARQQAEAANQAKSHFLANMSHEIRTPIGAVMGLVDLCLASGPSERQSGYLVKIKSASTGLLGVVNDILDWLLMDSGQLSEKGC